MKPQEIRQVEEIVNAQIRRNLPVETRIMELEAAKSLGAMALFGEKYDDHVRVLQMGDFSTELCGERTPAVPEISAFSASFLNPEPPLAFVVSKR